MKHRLRIFDLTKRDQRVVVFIMILLLVIAVAERYRENRSLIATPTTTIPRATPTDERAIAH